MGEVPSIRHGLCSSSTSFHLFFNRLALLLLSVLLLAVVFRLIFFWFLLCFDTKTSTGPAPIVPGDKVPVINFKNI